MHWIIAIAEYKLQLVEGVAAHSDEEVSGELLDKGELM